MSSTAPKPNRRWTWLIGLAALLTLPGLALYRLGGGAEYRWLLIGLAAMSVFTFMVNAADKGRAEEGNWRIAESGLHLLELLGGWPGAFVAQRLLRHKNAKLSYQFVFWLIVALHQAVALDYLSGWKIARMAGGNLSR